MPVSLLTLSISVKHGIRSSRMLQCYMETTGSTLKTENSKEIF